MTTHREPAGNGAHDALGAVRGAAGAWLRKGNFAFYSPGARDFFANPEVSYQISDRLTATLGGNLFGGPAPTFFGQLGRNDNTYLSARYSLAGKSLRVRWRAGPPNTLSPRGRGECEISRLALVMKLKDLYEMVRDSERVLAF